MTEDVWVFGYGSLIWRPDFPYIASSPALLMNWTRRFWQGSHDHRGMPDAPGRVVTLVPMSGSACGGMAYRVRKSVATDVFEQLDYREKNGYQRIDTTLALKTGVEVDGVVYIAPVDNFAYLGEAPLTEIAQQIVRSEGPSGRNTDYLLELAAALRQLNFDDAHVFELESHVQNLITN